MVQPLSEIFYEMKLSDSEKNSIFGTSEHSYEDYDRTKSSFIYKNSDLIIMHSPNNKLELTFPDPLKLQSSYVEPDFESIIYIRNLTDGIMNLSLMLYSDEKDSSGQKETNTDIVETDKTTTKTQVGGKDIWDVYINRVSYMPSDKVTVDSEHNELNINERHLKDIYLKLDRLKPNNDYNIYYKWKPILMYDVQEMKSALIKHPDLFDIKRNFDVLTNIYFQYTISKERAIIKEFITKVAIS